MLADLFYLILGIFTYAVVGLIVQMILISKILIDRPAKKIFGWQPKNWWVNWIDSWRDIVDPKSVPPGSYVPFLHPFLSKIYFPLKILLWPFDLLLTVVGRYTT